MDQVDQKVEQWKARLLDLSRRNRLLHFQPGRTTHLKLVHPKPTALYDHIVIHGRSLTFYDTQPRDASAAEQPLLLPIDEGGENSSDDELGTFALPAPIRPDHVQVEADLAKLEGLLYRLRLRARTALQEQGVHVLFVALGFLEWLEADASTEITRSPLLLVPVDLERENLFSPYRLVPSGEDAVLNPTIVQKLQMDFGLKLEPGEEGWPSLQALLDWVLDQVGRRRGWHVVPDAYLGLFSFLKLSMYQDLAANGKRLAEHSLVRALAGDRGALAPPPAGLPAADELDHRVPPEDTFHILDADSSQWEAIEAAKAGLSFVLEGPPGTGKSQTIANIIAECLARGKRVLFVSEKMAALEVVYKRLAACGLADFCLEAHSHKANKREIIKQLQQALEVPKAQRSPDGFVLEDYAELRQRLNDYVRALHAEVQPLGISAYDAHGEVASRDGAPELVFTLPEPWTITPTRLNAWCRLVEDLQRVADILLDAPAHPWHGCLVHEYSLQMQDEIATHLALAHTLLGQLQQQSLALCSAMGLPPISTVADCRWLASTLPLIRATPYPPASWLTGADLEQLKGEARTLAAGAERYRNDRAGLLSLYHESLFDLDLAAMRSQLGEDTAGARAVFKEGSRGEDHGGEQALQHRVLVADALREATQALRVLAELGPPLAARSGLATPSTLIEAKDAAAVFEAALAVPQPTSSWFERSQLARLQSLMDEARAYYETDINDAPSLLAEYQPEVLSAEALALGERFATTYANVFRHLRPGYWRDRGRLRALHRQGQAPSYDNALRVLTLARRVASARAWLKDHRGEMADGFGAHFNDSNTDWDALLAGLRSARNLLDVFGSAPLPPRLVTLLTGPPSGKRAFRSDAERFLEAWSQLEHALARLGSVVRLDRLFASTRNHTPVLLDEIRDSLARWQGQLETFWAAYDTLSAARRHSNHRTLAQVARDLDTAMRLRAEETWIVEKEPALRERFGDRIHGLETDWPAMLDALEWTGRLITACGGELPEELVARLTQTTATLPGAADETALVETLNGAIAEVAYLRSLFPDELIGPGGAERTDLAALGAWIEQRRRSLGTLEEWLDFTRVQARCDAEGLGDFAAALVRERPPRPTWQAAFLRRFYRLWLDHRYQSTPVLAAFRGSHHEQLIERFRRRDEEQNRLATERVRSQILVRRPALNGFSSSGSELAILQREIGKRTRHKPIRRLFREIPTLLTMLKPCFLMSPLSVSQFLEVGSVEFDTLLFDEASQICPEDAIGAIMRCKQVIVVGDQQQLPPTRFFSAGLDSPDDDDDDDVYESVLDQCLANGIPLKRLLWHYRSRHEHLIAFSNHHFYGDSLVTFANADPGAEDRGVEFIHVPDGVYDRGRSHTNRIEAKRVADAVFEHAQRWPKRSLGVVAFSEAQQMAILQEIERRRRTDTGLDWFFQEDKGEPFFVKNLENVQGDERDTIIFSVGYGPDAAGVVSMNFGPLNRPGGERRLNVAITRARYQVRFISSLLPTDIDLSRATSDGAKLLRHYMEFAIDGPRALAASVSAPADIYQSPFEEAVADALRSRGLNVHSQIGCSGYRIDLGIVDPSAPGRYLLGIECDGRSYHSSRTARDRDRLRQSVLEGLGWRIHRIWSTDWMKDPEREILRVLQRLDDIGREPPSAGDGLLPGPPHEPPRPPSATPSPDPAPGQPPTSARSRVAPYVFAAPPLRAAKEEFYLTSSDVIARVVTECVETEGPIHIDEVARRVASCWGLERAKSRVREHVRKGIDHA